MSGATGMSVVIPSYETWPLLQRTLLAVLHDCGRLEGQWEVVVVDNDSGPETVSALLSLARSVEGLRVVLRKGLQGRNFQPGAARNIGIETASYDTLVFLDADCVPATGTLHAYRHATRDDRQTIFLGHRVFIDASGLDPVFVAQHREILEQAPRVKSASNYGMAVDRRMPELLAIESAEKPFDCLHGCNLALNVACLGDERFARSFDGHWGYEDIELGHRLQVAGRRFRYLPHSYVYHQEHACDEVARSRGRRRNFATAAALIPGFDAYRRRSSRACAVPSGTAVADAPELDGPTRP